MRRICAGKVCFHFLLFVLLPFCLSPRPIPRRPRRRSPFPADSPRWELEGQAKVAEYQGRKCLFLDGGAATVKDFEMRDGVVDGWPPLMSTAAADSAVTSTGDIPSAA
jgi:hypothetical protein